MTIPVSLGIDLGTSGLKAVALNAAGTVMAEDTQSYPLLTPQPGWTEQHPQDWLSAAAAALSALSLTLRTQGAQPVALGLSGQMHGLVSLDAHGDVLRPAPLWNDQRTGAQVAFIEQRIPRAELVARTGNRAVTGFQLPKLLWLREAEPAVFARMRHALLPKDYLGYVLTGEFATEPSDASGVGALNLARGTWDEDVLRAVDLDPALLPPVRRSTDIMGSLCREWAARTGLPEGLPVVAGGGDNAAAGIALGLTSERPEVGSLSLGTSGVIFAPLVSPTPDPDGRVHLFAHADGGYHLLGVTLASAGALRWLQDVVAPGTSVDQLIEEATGVRAGAEGVTFLPYLAGERSPLMNPEARGAFTGLSLAHGRAHLVRAVLEGTACALADAYDVIRPLAPLTTLLSTGGGARSDLWLGLVSGALGLPVQPTQARPGAAHGAAILAMPAGGLSSDLQSALRAMRPDALAPVDRQDMSVALHGYQQVRLTLYPTPAPTGPQPGL